MKKTRVMLSDLHPGQSFTASMGGVLSVGKIHIDDSMEYIYLCQNEKEGAGKPMFGYEYSWIIPVNDGVVCLESEGILNFSTEIEIITNPTTLNPAFILPGTPFKGNVRGVNVDGKFHSDGKLMWICFDDNIMEKGNTSPQMYGYNNSYYIGSSLDGSAGQDGLIYLPSRRIVIHEYSPHPCLKEAIQKSLEITAAIRKGEGEIEDMKRDLSKLREETIAYLKKMSRPSTGMGYNIHYDDDKGTISFGCGEVTVKKEEVEGFLKIVSAIKNRNFHEGSKLEEVIELSKRIIY